MSDDEPASLCAKCGCPDHPRRSDCPKCWNPCNAPAPAPSERCDPLAPSVALLSKLGSIVVHADEALSPDGHVFDGIALKALINDAEVRAWIKAMGVFLPVKR